MGWKRRESGYTEVVKRVDLTKEQIGRFRRIDRLSVILRRRLSTFMLDLMETQVENEAEKWDEIAELFGYSSLDEVFAANYILELRCYGREARLLKKPDEKGSTDGEEKGNTKTAG